MIMIYCIMVKSKEERGSMAKLIDLTAFPVSSVLPTLLKDKTTGKNIIWAADTYAQAGCKDTYQIEISQLIGSERVDIRPRVEKSLLEQEVRTKKKAEVFTPTWVCNQMNNYLDEDWFGKVGTFNSESEDHTSWTPSEDPVTFPEGKTWQDYVRSTRLEITCGEAPFLVSRYDAATGELIEPPFRRIGLLDRKLRVVSENTDKERSWLFWAMEALKSCYGYEYQGDSLLIGRVNVFLTFCDFYRDKFGEEPKKTSLHHVAEVISWNLWQMDGLSDTVPLGKPQEMYEQMSLFDNNDQAVPLCRIMDWRNGKEVIYKTLKGEATNG